MQFCICSSQHPRGLVQEIQKLRRHVGGSASESFGRWWSTQSLWWEACRYPTVSHSIPQCSKDLKKNHVGYVVCFIETQSDQGSTTLMFLHLSYPKCGFNGAWQVQILCGFPDCLVCCCTGLPRTP